MAISDPVTLTYDLRVKGFDFLPISTLLRHSILALGSSARQTDGQTDVGHQCTTPAPYWGGWHKTGRALQRKFLSQPSTKPAPAGSLLPARMLSPVRLTRDTLLGASLCASDRGI